MMIVIDKMLYGGLRFVLERIVDAVDAEADDVSSLNEELLAAQMRLELGEITPEECHAIEQDVVQRLRELRADQLGSITVVDPDAVSIDIDVDTNQDEPR